MPRPRAQRLVQIVKERESFGECSCGGEVLFYTDSGVKCSVCGKLYGIWYLRKKAKEHTEPPKNPHLEETVLAQAAT